MTLNTGPSYKPGEDDLYDKPASLYRTECVSKVDQSLPSATSSLGHGWPGALTYRQLLLGVLFGAAFLILDGSSTASLGWEGAPPSYLPVGLTLALLLCGGIRLCARGVHLQRGRSLSELPPADFLVVRTTGVDCDISRLRGCCGNIATAQHRHIAHWRVLRAMAGLQQRPLFLIHQAYPWHFTSRRESGGSRASRALLDRFERETERAKSHQE
jgi:hypothetical protein